MSSPAIASDVESGVLLAVAARPIRRTEIVLGQMARAWCPSSPSTSSSSAPWSSLVVKWVSGFAPPNPFLVGAYLLGEGVVLLTLALALSTRLSTLAAGVTAIAVFGAAWLGGVVGALGAGFHIAALTRHRRGGKDPGPDRRPLARRDLLPRTRVAGRPTARWRASGTRAIPSLPRPRPHGAIWSGLWPGSLLCWPPASSASNDGSCDPNDRALAHLSTRNRPGGRPPSRRWVPPPENRVPRTLRAL